MGAGDDDADRGDNNNNLPRGINRLSRECQQSPSAHIKGNLFSVVSDLLMNEARSEEKLKQKSLTKSEDSGHDSGQSSLNTGSAGSESFSESSG